MNTLKSSIFPSSEPVCRVIVDFSLTLESILPRSRPSFEKCVEPSRANNFDMKNVTAVFIQHDWGHDTVNYYRVQEYKSDIKKYFYFIRYQSLVPFSYFSDLQLLVWNAYYVYS